MAGGVAVAGELGAEFVDAAEFEFEAEEFDELEGDGFAVDVAVEVEDVDFHRELCAVVKSVGLIVISRRNFHTGRILLFADIFRQNCLITHTHIIKNFKDFRIEMVLVKVTAKDDNSLTFVKPRHLAFVVIKNIVAVLGFNQKSAVVNVCYFHNPPLQIRDFEQPLNFFNFQAFQIFISSIVILRQTCAVLPKAGRGFIAITKRHANHHTRPCTS